MAETKNTFIKSKMNQDLDQRLVPNGEYREGFNISVSQAEGADVGTLETVLGNVLVTDLGLSSTCNAEIIGHYVDDQNKTIYLFVTNFVDTSSDKVSNYPPDTVLCQVWRRNVETNINTKLVEGKFLNFSLTHPIMGVNLIEDLLFWTDNRNQPRKINVNSANPNNLTSPAYYSNDDQINVAKYYPHEPISLIKKYIVDYRILVQDTGYLPYVDEIVPTDSAFGTGLTVKIVAASSSGALEQIEIVNQGQGYRNNDIVTIAPKIGSALIKLTVEEASTMKDTCTEKLPVNCTYAAGLITTVTAGSAYALGALQSGTAISSTMDYTGALVKINAGATTSPYLARVTAQNIVGPTITIEWANKASGPVYFPATVTGVTSIEIGINPDYDANWPGDCQFLKDKFVRFAYRFKFNDNEYSLISPFTQPCFIPKQNGYFLSEDRAGTPVLDTEKAYEDTDNNVMQNMVTNVDLQIPCPEFLNESISSTFNNIQNELHVTDIEIIYKDDAENSLKVVDTITAESFSNLDFNTLVYNYQSRKPKKTLPSSEITRVSDKVPIRALAQEVTGNRVIYGNYVDGYTAMNTLDYEVSAVEKPENTSLKKEYPNHTLKQNRSYQVGIVLVDRYGRSSDVILSSLDNTKSTSTVVFSGSTVFHPFYSSGEKSMIEASDTWNGDSLRVKFNSEIPLKIPQRGYPGLFLGYTASDVSNITGGMGYLGPSYSNLATSGGSGTGLTVDIITQPAVIGGGSPIGKVIAVSINNPGQGYEQGDIITITGGTSGPVPVLSTFVYNPNSQPNLTGWYSYKIVVKQTEQDYYNVYLPGIVNGSLNTDGLDSVTTANVSLFADNINKVPKDLSTVGPSQTNYNSTENLSLRVNNTTSFSSVQNYPGTDLEKVTQISELTDLGVDLTRRSTTIRTAGTLITTVDLDGFSENIQPGMAVISIINSGGTETYDSSDGIYIKSYYADGADAKVLLNSAVTVTAGGNPDTITFGPPGVVYNAGNNPLIGVLSTSKKIGVSEQDGFKTQLSVAETTPVESLLDIYYETTSSGSISVLNRAISDGIPVSVPVKTTNIIFNLSESQTGAVGCTNTFTLLDNANNAIIGANIEGEIVSVFDKNNNNRTSEFSISDDNNGTFSIATTNTSGKGYYIKQNENNTTFDFSLLMTNDTYKIPVEFTGSIDNERPVYQGTTGNDGFVQVGRNGEIFGTPADKSIMFECLNGSGDTSLNTKEIQWEIINAKVINGKNRDRPLSLDPAFDWPMGYEESETATNVPSYVIQNGTQATSAFSLTNGVLSAGKFLNSFNTKINFNGLNGLGGSTTVTVTDDMNWYVDLFNDPGTSSETFQTSELVQFIKFELTIAAKDRNGSGQVAESSGTDTSLIKIIVTAD